MQRSERAQWWPLLVASGLALVAMGVVARIADSVRENDTVVHTDTRIVRWMVEHRTAFLTDVARVVTQLGSGWVVAAVVVLTVAALARRGHWPAIAVVAVSTAGAAALVEVTKHLVSRARPPVAERLVIAHGLAFPSGHAAQSVACYGALAWLAWELGGTRRVRIVACATATAVALTVGLSRVYLGVHWPSDVVCGWLVGAGWLTVLIGASLARQAPERT